jgi:hypothetical protein
MVDGLDTRNDVDESGAVVVDSHVENLVVELPPSLLAGPW